MRRKLPKNTEAKFHSDNAAAANAAPKERRADPARWLLLLLPILLVAANRGWIFTSPNWIDPWVYFGYFQHLALYKSTLFPNLYYGSRLPWILPGYLAYHFFRPETANYVLHFVFYYAATFSFYSLLRRAVGDKNALLGTVLFGTYASFLSAIGWDYVDGAGATYFLLALAASARATRSRPRQWLLISGMAALAMCYTNMFLITFLPFVPGLYVFLKFSGLNRNSLGAIRELIVWFGAGAVLVSVVLGAINYGLDRNFWFYSPSISFYRAMHSQPNPWRAQGWAWLREAYWLGIPAAATIASLAYVFRGLARRDLKLRDFRTFFVFQFLVIAGGMVGWQAVGSTGLSLTFYASYMIPAMFLAIGCVLGGGRDDPPTYGWWPILIGSIALFVWSLSVANGEWAQRLRTPMNLRVACAIAASGLVCSVLFRRKWYMVVPLVMGLAIYQVPYSGFDSPSDRYEIGWRNVVEGSNAIWPYELKRPVSFWYNANEPHGQEIYGINSVYLWGYTYVGTEFPKIEVPSRLVAGATIVMPAGSSQWLERANDVLHSNHFEGTLIGTYTVGHDASSFQIGFIRLENYPAR